MNAPHEEAVEFSKQSIRERRVYVGNLSYDTRYRDLLEFMRGGGLGTQLLLFGFLYFTLWRRRPQGRHFWRDWFLSYESLREVRLVNEVWD
jgi:hypothetical protein